MEANKDALARLVTREVGKPLAESLGEVQEIIDTCDFFLGEGRRLYGETVPSEMNDKALFTFRVPVGHVAVITAGNFPVAVPSWYLVPALLCGNSVVWKPAEYASGVATALYECLVAGGLPDGVLNLVLAEGAATFSGLEMALSQRLVDKVGFTGSSAVGSAIGELCGRHLQSACLELGGQEPHGDHARRRPRARGRRRALLGLRHGRAAMHVPRHGDRARVGARRVPRRSSWVASRPRPSATLSKRCCTARCSTSALPLDSRSTSQALILPHHRVLGSTATGRITSGSPRAGFLGDPDTGVFCHPSIVDGVRPRGRDRADRDLRADDRRRHLR